MTHFLTCESRRFFAATLLSMSGPAARSVGLWLRMPHECAAPSAHPAAVCK
jgi:hypothetical protein